MPQIGCQCRIQTLTAVLISLACVGLAACGGSSGSSSSSASTPTAATTTAAATTTTGSTTTSTGTTANTLPTKGIGKLRTLAKCMRRNGIDIPEPSATGGFDTTGINENTPQFKLVVDECFQALQSGKGG